MLVPVVLASLLTLPIAALGTIKVLALPMARSNAAHVGMSTDAFRLIGVLEILGALGVALGLFVPVLGAAASVGLVLLMVGGVMAHVRVGDALAAAVPAAVFGIAAAAYLTLMITVQ